MVHQTPSFGDLNRAPLVSEGRRAEHALLLALQPELRQERRTQRGRRGHQDHRGTPAETQSASVHDPG